MSGSQPDSTDRFIERTQLRNAPRISVIGTSCSGKSTFSNKIATLSGVRHVELDSIFWSPDWRRTETADFVTRIQELVHSPGWVIDGNYQAACHLVWTQADLIVWLDYSFPIIFARALARTWKRVVRRQPCCNGNFETWRTTFSRDSILLWVITTYSKRRREFQRVLPLLIDQGKEVLIFRSPKETENWLQTIPNTTACQQSAE